ncbi:MAG TPA: DUF2339 domain-containing protein [Acidobacteriaceae bacterium]|nr:DUF2339 domain-containing protein [Acidobacteriaceae bacterium]
MKRRVARLEAALPATSAEEGAWVEAQRPAAAAKEDLETRIGSRLFNRIGIVAVLIGVAWFLKIAFDNRWLGSVGKVSAGLLAGLGLYAWSERFGRHGYLAFSYSLKAVAAGLLYLSLWAAWSLFHLLSLPVAAAAMILVTAGNGLLAWKRESELLAFYAAIGGYLTPLLLTNGQNHGAPLFSYLLLLNGSALALLAARPWPRLALGAFLATTAYAIGWYAVYYSEAQFGMTLAFAVIFLLVFAATPYVARGGVALAGEARFSGILVTVAVLNATFALVEIIFLFDIGTRGWAALALAALFFALARTKRLAGIHLLTATCFVLAAVGFGIHSYWAGTPNSAVDEQISYSAWFMLAGAAALAVGFWRRSSALRWQGLLLLCLSIGKVFLVDMRTLSQGFRVLSFLGLGALLLAVSFVYQRDWLNLRAR